MKAPLWAALFSTIVSGFAMGANAVITVDLKRKTVDPPNPIVNVAAADSIEIRLVEDGQPISEFDFNILTTINGGLTFSRAGANPPTPVHTAPVVRSSSIILNTKRCGWKESKDDFEGVKLPRSQKVPCPSIVVGESGFLTLYAENSAIGFNVIALARASTERGAGVRDLGVTWSDQVAMPAVVPSPRNYNFPFSVQLVARGANLFWSLGMTWFDTRDEQFVLRPAANNLAEVIAAGEAGPIYQIGANVHYGLSITRPPWNHLSLLFGLSADVPVDSLSAYLGLAATAWTFPEGNAGHIFVGLGYTKADRLAPEYLGLTSVPDATPASALVRSEYDFGITAGISFSFFGGQDQFKAAFPGKASGEAAP